MSSGHMRAVLARGHEWLPYFGLRLEKLVAGIRGRLSFQNHRFWDRGPVITPPHHFLWKGGWGWGKLCAESGVRKIRILISAVV